ncbi:hypothetical protein AFE_2098 [Acidithiobacillus ferrooxidans ATCC 23270]|uniref:Uncharacterized protein n=1 Tax=Acidithiobacillus ferrooxidans (strain ATCC 23270 / DSM 14882 / CIP 104768 / NCIMB 8455) TaxID=243159 RepID=B7J4V8_ACIF2|nr:hypothetical protein AFE_2098 [Acidithiobacillus ferrooxidans ATCC 23270]
MILLLTFGLPILRRNISPISNLNLLQIFISVKIIILLKYASEPKAFYHI